MIFALCRISTTKETQKTDRQVLALQEYARQNNFVIDEIIEEIMSGKDIDRPIYNKLKSKLRSGDYLLITDVDRLGRNADQTIIEFKQLKSMGVKVIALDVPLLNDWNKVNDNSLYDMITDVFITLKAHLAQQEREKLISRINQGLDVAKAKGRSLGRPKQVISKEVMNCYTRIKNGELKKIEAAKILGISRQHLDRLIKQIEET